MDVLVCREPAKVKVHEEEVGRKVFNILVHLYKMLMAVAHKR